MIHEEHEEIRITGGSPEWQAIYSWERFDGPLKLIVDGTDLITGCSTRFDDLAEDLVMVDQCKAYRKGHGAMVGKSGRMPIGAETSYKVSHRYSNNALKVVKDFFVPRGVTVENEIVIDALTLDGGFKEYQVHFDALEPSEWTSIGEGVNWSDAPIILCLKHETGIILEIGQGNDLWRWSEGFVQGDDSQPCGASLKPSDDGLCLSRYGAMVSETTDLTPRSYRFSWYLAWRDPKLASDMTPGPTVPLTHRPNGDVAMGALAKALEEHPGAFITLDIAAMPVPDQLKKSDGSSLCLASNQTIKRLKRVIRQLSGLETDDPKSLHFKNLLPGVCTIGNHVHGKTDRKHWDMNSILDFAIWARQALGNDWELTNDVALDLPSLMGAFSKTDHTEPPIQYEFNSASS